ncbi:potassium channel family protein [Micromonospora sp. WMMD812]|uniref:potassium channel family protein n=1 Tax=Micromonospora sp. WMMD812 TaxID=3015152 RepID=UPI00248C0100|nr:potassium channel family protein [Micromonospora sp. WMMD812]WBB70136.1 potassium channel family protein [Micromonospora sp. WMMD812]
MTTERPWRRERRRATLGAALLLLAYFVIPVEPHANHALVATRAALTLLTLLAVLWLVTRQVRRQLTAAPTGHPQALALLRLTITLVAGLLTFALADYKIARTWPGQFGGVETRVDALYFALATLTTIGYGDVSAEGQIARAFVCAQMIFSVGVLATGVSVLVRQAVQSPRRR